eukprot:scaffold18.g1937.t1
MATTVRVLRLRGVPILRQLQLEEALMRADAANWMLVNDGAPDPAIVLGISGKPQELVHVEAAAAAGVPMIKRFTGGGTVVVDADTIFCSLVMHQAAVPHVPAYPRPIMRWTEEVYGRVFGAHGQFALREHDYAFGHRKFGGNAQAITKGRWVHHTSLLWGFRPERMRLLKQPARAPQYREGRDHLEFVMALQELLPSREALLDQLAGCLEGAGFCLQPAELGEAEEALERNALCGTRVLDWADHLPGTS